MRIAIDPTATHHPFAVWDYAAHGFRPVPGEYVVYVGTSADDTSHTPTISNP